MVIIFDLDGTILDTYQLIRQNFVEVFDKYLPEYKYTEKDLESFFGPPLSVSFMKVTNDLDMTNFLISKYREINIINHDKYLTIFPGAFEALKVFKSKGYHLVILSNKNHRSIESGLINTNVFQYFDYIVGLDDVSNPKPHPEGILNIKKHFNNDQCIFIGDALSDIMAAKNAKITSIGCTWALTSKEAFMKANANYIVDSFEELVKLVEEIYV